MGGRRWQAVALIVDDGKDENARLVDEVLVEDSTIDPATTFEQKPLDAENLADGAERPGKIVSLGSGENERDAAGGDVRYMGFRDPFGDN